MTLIMALGIILLGGVVGGKVVKSIFRLPSVTGYIFAGIILGPTVFNIIDVPMQEELYPVSDIAMGILAVAIGGELKVSALRSIWRDLCQVFFAESFITFIFVSLTGWAFSGSLPVGLLLGMLALASAPNTTIAILRDYKLKGDFPRSVLSLVALDNILCLILFSVLVGFFSLFWEGNDGGMVLWLSVFGRLALSIVMGLCLGFVMVYLNNVIRNDNEMLVISLGFIFSAVGLGFWLGMQPLFITMMMGFVIVNISSKSMRFFDLIQRIDAPILVAFLTLAGVKINFGHLAEIGFLGGGYILVRYLGKVWGSRVGGALCEKIPKNHRKYLGSALIPQAGVAVGLAIMVERELPLVEGMILPVILGAVIVFEVLGPILFRRSLVLTNSIRDE